MLKDKIRRFLIGGALISMTFVGTALIYYKNNFHQRGILTFNANNANAINVLFWMIFFIMIVLMYVIIENCKIRKELKDNKELLYKVLEQGATNYNELQKSNMNTREILFDLFSSKNNIA